MSRADIAAIARAALYEGYLLYPYRASSVKNRQGWGIGTLFPRAVCETWGSGDRWAARAVLLAQAQGDACVTAQLRFLQSVVNTRGERDAIEREVEVPPATLADLFLRPSASAELILTTAGTLACGARLSARPLSRDVVEIQIDIQNTGQPAAGCAMSREAFTSTALIGAHAVVQVASGRLVSLAEPEPNLAAEARRCADASDGLWPTLVGPDTALACPLILPDHPAIAPESPCDLFDATEIDEILSLRVLTMTEDEKTEARALDLRARALIDRCEALGPDEWARLHGRRGAGAAPVPARSRFQIGDRVTIRPRRQADALDGLLVGRAATVAAVEEDLEGHVWLVVTVDDDPGKDLGVAGFPGHRFFFAPDDLEPR